MKPLNRFMVGVVSLMPKSIVWLFSRRYIAGASLADGVATTRALNGLGCRATIDLLGEHTTRLEDAQQAEAECLRVLEAIDREGLDANLSVKLTALGLKLDTEQCYRHVAGIVARAAELGNFVRIDMEDSTCTDETLAIYRRLRKAHTNVGTVIQARLKRSCDDVRRLIDEGIAHLRICKGIYDEPAEIAHTGRDAIRDSYMELVRMMLESSSHVAIATHDGELIRRSEHLLASLGVGADAHEFQMLLGVAERTRAGLVSAGRPVRVYVPYGEAWHAYSMRRLQECPHIAGHIVKNLFTRR
jgi:proline dehydrogenase